MEQTDTHTHTHKDTYTDKVCRSLQSRLTIDKWHISNSDTSNISCLDSYYLCGQDIYDHFAFIDCVIINAIKHDLLFDSISIKKPFVCDTSISMQETQSMMELFVLAQAIQHHKNTARMHAVSSQKTDKVCLFWLGICSSIVWPILLKAESSNLVEKEVWKRVRLLLLLN